MKVLILIIFALASIQTFAADTKSPSCRTQYYLSKLGNKELFGQSNSRELFDYARNVKITLGGCVFEKEVSQSHSIFSSIKLTSNGVDLVPEIILKDDSKADEIYSLNLTREAMFKFRQALAACGCTRL